MNLSPGPPQQRPVEFFWGPLWHFTFSLHLVDTECEHAFLSDKSQGSVLNVAMETRGMRRARSFHLPNVNWTTSSAFCCFAAECRRQERRVADKGCFVRTSSRLFDANAWAKGDPIQGMQHCSVKMTSHERNTSKSQLKHTLTSLWTQIYNYYTKERLYVIAKDSSRVAEVTWNSCCGAVQFSKWVLRRNFS